MSCSELSLSSMSPVIPELSANKKLRIGSFRIARDSDGTVAGVAKFCADSGLHPLADFKDSLCQSSIPDGRPRNEMQLRRTWVARSGLLHCWMLPHLRGEFP